MPLTSRYRCALKVFAATVLVIAALLVALLLMVANGGGRESDESAAIGASAAFSVSDVLVFEDDDAAGATASATAVSYPLTTEGADVVIAAIDSLAEGEDDPTAFAAITADGEAVVERADAYPEIASALDAFVDRGYEAGFVLYDFETGRALACGLDRTYYCASTIKGPFVTYLSENIVDAGLATYDDIVEEIELIAGSGIMDTDGVSLYPLREVAENVIRYSDNTAYRLLWRLYGGSGFEAWAANCGVDASAWGGAEYPWISVRELAKLWVGIGRYLGGEAASAAWLDDLFVQSENSFLRCALGEDVAVLSKPGFDSNLWYYTSADMGALHDAGIVEGAAGSYLIVIMSNADYDSDVQAENEILVEDLIHALANVQASWGAEGA